MFLARFHFIQQLFLLVFPFLPGRSRVLGVESKVLVDLHSSLKMISINFLFLSGKIARTLRFGQISLPLPWWARTWRCCRRISREACWGCHWKIWLKFSGRSWEQDLLVGRNCVGEIVVGGVLVDPSKSPQKDGGPHASVKVSMKGKC